MARVTEVEVRAIIDVADDVTDLTPFITTANLLVTEVCSDSDYSVARLKEIELWLSAHFTAIRDPRSTSEGAGGVTQSFQGKTEMGLKATTYGQQALLLDSDGNLAQLGDKIPDAGFTWLGSSRETLETYEHE